MLEHIDKVAFKSKNNSQNQTSRLEATMTQTNSQILRLNLALFNPRRKRALYVGVKKY